MAGESKKVERGGRVKRSATKKETTSAPKPRAQRPVMVFEEVWGFTQLESNRSGWDDLDD